MRVEYDHDACIGMFQCVDGWEGFEKNVDNGEADLVDGKEANDGIFVREVPEGAELDAKFAARVYPVETIRILDDDGKQLVP